LKKAVTSVLPTQDSVMILHHPANGLFKGNVQLLDLLKSVVQLL
jgi:hypothetical protein